MNAGNVKNPVIIIMTFATLETIEILMVVANLMIKKMKKKKTAGGQQDLLYLNIFLPGSLNRPECLKCFY